MFISLKSDSGPLILPIAPTSVTIGIPLDSSSSPTTNLSAFISLIFTEGPFISNLPPPVIPPPGG